MRRLGGALTGAATIAASQQLVKYDAEKKDKNDKKLLTENFKLLLPPLTILHQLIRLAAPSSSISLCDSNVTENVLKTALVPMGWIPSVTMASSFLSFFTSSTSTASPSKIITYTYPANLPSEDRHFVQSSPNDGWTVVSVFDGHGGYHVSQFASTKLGPRLLKNMSDLDAKNIQQGSDGKTETDTSLERSIEACIVDTFASIENEYLDSIRQAFNLGFGEVAKVGSCVLVALRKGNNLILANLGDCRAVLGSASSSQASAPLVATTLTHDHNAREKLEAIKLMQEHPGESDIIMCHSSHACYVKGRLQLTRALGDAYLKHKEFNAPSGMPRSYGRHIKEPFTPPYVSHIPEVHNYTVGPADKFVILASDGLWDFLTPQEAVAIVEKSSEDDAASKLVYAALENAAIKRNLSLEQLLSLPQGRSRRSVHDDTTVVVYYL